MKIVHVDINVLKRIRRDANVLLGGAKAFPANFRTEAINWGDLSCEEVCYVINDSGEESYRVIVSECSPSANSFKQFIYDGLRAVYPKYEFEVSMEW